MLRQGVGNCFETTLRSLAEGRVRFIVVGGVAAAAHGAARATYDVDVVYERSPENLDRLAVALEPLRPYLRGAPPGLPFRWNAATLARGLNFTLTTTGGDLALLGEITGGGRFEDLRPSSFETEMFGVTVLCLGLEKLIEVKRAAGRPKDLEAIAELELLRDRSTPR